MASIGQISSQILKFGQEIFKPPTTISKNGAVFFFVGKFSVGQLNLYCKIEPKKNKL